MWRSQKKAAGSPNLVFGNGRQGVRLTNGVRGDAVDARATARVTVTVAAATSLRNRGSVFALYPEVVLDENGTDRHLCTGAVLKYLTEVNAPSATTNKRLPALADGTIAVGVYLLEEMARMFFAWPNAGTPGETQYLESNSQQALQFLMTPVASAALATASLVVAGGATVVVDQMAAEIVHNFELPEAGQDAPLFIPTVRQQLAFINGAVGQQAEYIRSPHAIRAIILSQEVSTGGVTLEVSDIINSLTFRGDFRTPVGPGKVTMAMLRYQAEMTHGGAVISAVPAHYPMTFQKYGKLGDVLNPAGDLNLRYEFDAQPSATGGQSQIRITICELQRIAGLTAQKIPFPY